MSINIPPSLLKEIETLPPGIEAYPEEMIRFPNQMTAPLESKPASNNPVQATRRSSCDDQERSLPHPRSACKG